MQLTENKLIMDKKKQNSSGKSKEDIQKKKEKRMQSKKMKQMMKKRLIIRNLSFKVSEEQLKEIFSHFGEVLEVKIPVNEAGRKRGFAFVRYKDTKSQIKALKALNFKKIYGRPIAIDFAVDKTTYQSHHNKPTSDSSKNDTFNEYKTNLDSDVDSEDKSINTETKLVMDSDNDADGASEDEEDSKVKEFLKEFDADKELEKSHESETSDESSEDSDDNENESHPCGEDDDGVKDSPIKKKHSEDVSEGKTVFIRNVSFKNTQEDLQEVVQEYGDTVYCLLCTDPFTDHPKGTAFVKFKKKEGADKLIKESSEEPGILLDGRRLLCTYAVTRKELSKMNDGSQKRKDKRNLRLLKCGLIMYGSKESEGVSQSDMAKRAQLETVKKRKLRNVNFFVSDKRLAVHNLPKNITDKDLYALFKNAAGKGTVIKEARVMKDFKKTNAQGIPVSRGFGFVSFTEHEHALKALMELNNNPEIFTLNKRPIVEFSIENKVALFSQERKREKLKMQHKRKLEEKLANNRNQTEENSNQKGPELCSIHFKKIKNEENNHHIRKKKKQNSKNASLYVGTQERASKKKQYINSPKSTTGQNAPKKYRKALKRLRKD